MGYIDPGLFGLVSQVGLMVFLVVVSAFTFFLKPIKKFFYKLFNKDYPDPASPQSNEDEVNQ